MCVFNDNWSDYDGYVHHLTCAEKQWFRNICSSCSSATGIYVPIHYANHDDLKGKHKEALGLIHTDDKECPLNSSTYITIDNYFIHECYERAINGVPMLITDTVEQVIAHEYAHLYQWRHCKKHRAISKVMYEKIMRYKGR